MKRHMGLSCLWTLMGKQLFNWTTENPGITSWVSSFKPETLIFMLFSEMFVRPQKLNGNFRFQPLPACLLHAPHPWWHHARNQRSHSTRIILQDGFYRSSHPQCFIGDSSYWYTFAKFRGKIFARILSFIIPASEASCGMGYGGWEMLWYVRYLLPGGST